ncbi:MAG: hypothetical protein ACK4OE_03765 [Acidovorax sp.]|uniref:hypothetical protein n=1 Tax=Acidovorax sp. TaxID=1872122 RepID=UPI003918D502
MATSEHEEFHRTFHAALVAFLVVDESSIAALQARFAQYADTWTRAMASGFYRAAHLYPALMDSEKDFYAFSAAELAQLVAPGIDTGPECSADVRSITAGFEATLAYEATDGALKLEQINSLANGLATLLIANPAFAEHRGRERVLQSLCRDVTIDVMGE